RFRRRSPGLHRIPTRYWPGGDAATVRGRSRGHHLGAGELPGARPSHDCRPALRRRRAALRLRRSPEARPHRAYRWEAGVVSETESRKEEGPDEEARPLTGEPVGPAPMRLRAEPPRVTRLSRKVLAGLGLVASVGIGGTLIYAL